MLKLNNLWNYLKIWLESRSYKTKTVPAHGWYAVYQTEASYQAFPLIAWEISYYDDVALEAVGLVFDKNMPPTLEHADDLENFVGYQLRLNGAQSQLFSVPCYENN